MQGQIELFLSSNITVVKYKILENCVELLQTLSIHAQNICLSAPLVKTQVRLQKQSCHRKRDKSPPSSVLIIDLFDLETRFAVWIYPRVKSNGALLHALWSEPTNFSAIILYPRWWKILRQHLEALGSSQRDLPTSKSPQMIELKAQFSSIGADSWEVERVCEDYWRLFVTEQLAARVGICRVALLGLARQQSLQLREWVRFRDALSNGVRLADSPKKNPMPWSRGGWSPNWTSATTVLQLRSIACHPHKDRKTYHPWFSMQADLGESPLACLDWFGDRCGTKPACHDWAISPRCGFCCDPIFGILNDRIWFLGRLCRSSWIESRELESHNILKVQWRESRWRGGFRVAVRGSLCFGPYRESDCHKIGGAGRTWRVLRNPESTKSNDGIVVLLEILCCTAA